MRNEKPIEAIKNKGPMKKPSKVDKDLVFRLAQTLLPVTTIATILKISPGVLMRNFEWEIRRGREDRKHTLVQAMWHKALIEKDGKMQIWLSKQHLGYRDSAPEQAQQVVFNVKCNEVPTHDGNIIHVGSSSSGDTSGLCISNQSDDGGVIENQLSSYPEGKRGQ
jgi:hypothetical protein